MSDSDGNSVNAVTYTAFGERVCALSGSCAPGDPNPRYGYAGAWGYQAHSECPYLHVGARYYDPATGRFLQRDPIGIMGGLNVYEYVRSRPAKRLDPHGLYYDQDPAWSWGGFAGDVVKGGIAGGAAGGMVGGVGAKPGAAVGALAAGCAYAGWWALGNIYVRASDILEAFDDVNEAKIEDHRKRKEHPEFFPPAPPRDPPEVPCGPHY